MGIGGLSDEQSSHRDVEAAAVCVERIARRNHKAHQALGAADSFQLLDKQRECGLRGTGGEYQHNLFLDVEKESKNAESRDPGDGTEHQEHEDRAQAVKGEN